MTHRPPMGASNCIASPPQALAVDPRREKRERLQYSLRNTSRTETGARPAGPLQGAAVYGTACVVEHALGALPLDAVSLDAA